MSLRLRRPAQTLGPLGLALCLACGADDGGATSDAADTQTSESDTSGSTTDAETDTETDTSGETETETGEQSCYTELHAIVSDIDETLTTSDSEFLMQMLDSSYDPMERAESAELINDYHARGYTVVYLTARAEPQSSADNIPARTLTFDWLEAHGFPVDDNTRLILAESFVSGDSAAAYKGQALIDLQAEGYSVDYAYGNAVSDIQGYAMAGIGKDVTFIIGEQAGVDGTVAIEGEDWIMHRSVQIPMVADYCE